MKIYAALCAVLTALSSEGISKSRNNTQQNYKFRGIDDIYNAISGLFAQNKILPLPRYSSVVQSERESGSGKAIFVTRLEGYFKLKSLEDGSEVEIGPFPGEAMDSADKSTNKAMSASFKYALLQTFVIPTEADNDADNTTHDVAARRPDRQIDRSQDPARETPRKSALVGGTENIPVDENGVRQKRGPSDGHPIMLQLEAALNKYGERRPDFEIKVAESMGVKTIYDIPVAVIPQALLKVIEHQKAAKASKAQKTAAAGAKPARKPAGKKADLPPPDDSRAPPMQEPDGEFEGDDRIPV